MEVKQIIAELDHEIARLKEARALLAGESSGARRPGRPAGRPAKAAAKSAGTAATPRNAGKRRLSPEGRRRIQEALKRRWAAQRKSAKAEKAA